MLLRTTLTEEPELGRKKVDLLKLYKRITEEGGYDKVTEEKGMENKEMDMWKQPYFAVG